MKNRQFRATSAATGSTFAPNRLPDVDVIEVGADFRVVKPDFETAPAKEVLAWFRLLHMARSQNETIAAPPCATEKTRHHKNIAAQVIETEGGIRAPRCVTAPPDQP